MQIDILEEKKAINKQVDVIVNKILENQDDFEISTFHLLELPESENWENHPNIDTDFKHHVNKLNNYNKDCLYWFSCEDAEKAKELDKALCVYRGNKGKPHYRVVPTTNRLEGKIILFM
ncbi:hypothetical protein JCM19275_3168 [Nonlabens ulvanivorans]|uniref:Uncharacterized protein n=1 Tax=Nonlabens ulvanivorans TaxID=906888 RepID=A0A090WDL0_NONUL|nr:hypothetical protein [Nonlabens ulvanivorans]GAL74313.1 hypothetical protein JCM19275_3168 [Nonlabens ulvanivorans]